MGKREFSLYTAAHVILCKSVWFWRILVAQGTPKVDATAKLIGFVSALLLLVAVYYFIHSLVNTVDRNTTVGAVVEEPKAPAESAPQKTASAAPAQSSESSSAPKAEKTADNSNGGGNAAAGKTKYASCAACHGADGKGNGGAFPNLTKLNAADAETILTAFKNGDKATLKKHGLGGGRYGIMAPNAQGLSKQDIKDLSAYIAQLGGHSAAASEPAKSASNGGGSSAGGIGGDAAAGKTKYASCAACHGADGKGNGGAFPNLTKLNAEDAYHILKAFKSGDKAALKKRGLGGSRYGIMAPNAAGLSDQDMKDLAAYIAKLGGNSASASSAGKSGGESKAAAAPAKKVKGDIAFGRALYSSCAVCHGADAEGGHLLGAPQLKGLPAATVVSMLKTYRKGQKVGPKSYYMFSQANHLSDSDINDLAAYIDSLSKKKG